MTGTLGISTTQTTPCGLLQESWKRCTSLWSIRSKSHCTQKLIQAAAQEIVEIAQKDHAEYESVWIFPGDGTIRLTVPLSGDGIDFDYNLRNMVQVNCECGDDEYRRLMAKMLRELADLAEVSK